MKRQVSFADEAEAYRFVLADNEDVAFEISKDTLTFDSDDFYRLFFKGLDEKPEYEVANPDGKLKGQAKHVFDTVAAIFKKACDSIDAAWFVKTEEPAVATVDDLNNTDI